MYLLTSVYNYPDIEYILNIEEIKSDAQYDILCKKHYSYNCNFLKCYKNVILTSLVIPVLADMDLPVTFIEFSSSAKLMAYFSTLKNYIILHNITIDVPYKLTLSAVILNENIKNNYINGFVRNLLLTELLTDL